MQPSVSKCVSIVFAKGRHYGAERAIRKALPRISSYIFSTDSDSDTIS